MNVTIHLPSLPAAVLITLGAIVLLACAVRLLVNHFYNRGWWDCREKHVDFALRQDRESRERI